MSSCQLVTQTEKEDLVDERLREIAQQGAERGTGDTAFATDAAVKPAERREADGVLRLYGQRQEDLDSHAKTTVAPPAILGLLMLVPEKGDK